MSYDKFIIENSVTHVDTPPLNSNKRFKIDTDVHYLIYWHMFGSGNLSMVRI